MSSRVVKPRKDFSDELAEKVIKMLEDGTAPWIKPWEAGEIQLPYNPISGTRYKGANIIALYGEADPRWMTYKQAKEKGWNVVKGAKATRVQYWKLYDEHVKKDASGNVITKNGKPEKIRIKRKFPTVFYANVFNASQIKGIPKLENDRKTYKWENEEQVEALISASNVKITHQSGDRAFYNQTHDVITLPEKKQFSSSEKYYATAMHELGHSTGHSSRLNRDMTGGHGSEKYAKEELRAELSSFITCAELGLGHDPGQHVAYIGSWIKSIKEDTKELFRAAADAEKISNVLLNPSLQKTYYIAKDQEASISEEIKDKQGFLKVVNLKGIKFKDSLGFKMIDGYALESLKGCYVADTEGSPMVFTKKNVAEKVAKDMNNSNIEQTFTTPELYNKSAHPNQPSRVQVLKHKNQATKELEGR